MQPQATDAMSCTLLSLKPHCSSDFRDCDLMTHRSACQCNLQICWTLQVLSQVNLWQNSHSLVWLEGLHVSILSSSANLSSTTCADKDTTSLMFCMACRGYMNICMTGYIGWRAEFSWSKIAGKDAFLLTFLLVSCSSPPIMNSSSNRYTCLHQVLVSFC